MRRSASRLLPLVAAFIVLAPALAQAAPWLQAGGDAGRTGATADAGPVWGDVALRVHLGAPRADHAPPVILGGGAFVLTTDSDAGSSTLHRVDLQSADVARVATLDSVATSLASDGTFVLVTTPREVHAVPVTGAAGGWSAPLVYEDEPEVQAACAPPALSAGMLFVACELHGARPMGPGPQPVPAVRVRAFDAATGSLERSWMVSPLVGPSAEDAGAGPDTAQFLLGFVVEGRDPVVLMDVRKAVGAPDPVDGPLSARAEEQRYRLAGFSWDTGLRAWDIESGPDILYAADAAPAEGGASPLGPLPLAASGGLVYARLPGEPLRAFDAATGEERARFGDEDVAGFAQGPSRSAKTGGLGVTADAIYVTSGRTLAKWDPVNGTETWRAQMLEVWSAEPVIEAGGRVYVRAVAVSGSSWSEGVLSTEQRRAPMETASTLHARDASTGNPLWSLGLSEGDGVRARELVAVGEGVLVTAGADGLVTVIGRTAASPTARAAITPASPEPGDVVRVDLSGSEHGLFGPATAYRAEWGDGAVTPWQSEPVLSHRYDAEGAFRAVFSVRNDAGQTASEITTIRTDVASVGISGAGVMPRVHPAWTTLLLVGAALVVTAGVRAQRERALLASAVPRPGARFLRKYRIERELGRGAFGSAWLATRLADDARVVVKQLHGELASDAKARTRFLREARILRDLDHPHVTRLLAVERGGRKEDAPVFIVLEFVDGGSAQALIAPGASLSTTSAWDDSMTQDWNAPAPAGVPAQDAVRLAADVLAGLAHVHARGIVHRDVKPSNVLLTAGGRGKVADFGVARLADPAATLASTAGGAQPGTLAYMAPEVVRGHAGDARADLYAVAVMFVHLVTGRFYLGARPLDEFELRRRILEERPTLTGVPPALAEWAARALAKDADARWPDAGAMRDALLAAAREDGVTGEG